METELTRPSYRALTRFFLPLVVISFSQTFTYPLVASVISHGPLGGLEYEAYVIGNQVVNFLSSFGFSLITTGIVFATTKASLRNFTLLIVLVTGTTTLCQLIASLLAMENLVFGKILAVDDPELRHIARHSILACIPVRISFDIRNAWTAHLFRNKRSDLANVATLVRVVLAVLLSVTFVRVGLVGYLWGAVAMTLPSFVETAISWWYARPFVAALPTESPDGQPPASILRLLHFTIPLSLGSVLMTATAFIATYFYSYSSDPEGYRLIHYVTYGLAVAFFAAAFKFQTVAVVFAKSRPAARRVAAFVLISSASLGAFLLAASFVKPFARWYFCVFQKIPPDALGLATAALTVSVFATLFYGLRGFAEGLAAVRLTPRAVLLGQLAYVLVFAGAFALCTRVMVGRDHLWGMTAITVATALSATATYVASRLLDVSAAGKRERSRRRSAATPPLPAGRVRTG